MRLVSICAALAVLSACSYDEGFFNRRVKELDDLAAKGTPAAKEKIQTKKAELLAAFKKLPKGEGRKKKLDQLGRRAREVVKEAEQILAGEAATRKKADDAKLKKYREKFVGRWVGEGMKLRISPAGMVNYERKKGAGSRKISAFIEEFSWKSFKVGLMGINTTFVINKPPHEEGGKWKMTIDGVELTRVGAGSKFGTWVCPELRDEACHNPGTKFVLGSFEKLHLLHVTAKLPKKGDVYKVVWIGEDLGKVAPPGAKIAESPIAPYDGKNRDKATHYTVHGHIGFPKERGWPLGKYRVEVYKGEEKVVELKFSVEKGGAEEKGEDKTP